MSNENSERTMAQYGKKTSKKVEKAMHERGRRER
jgi:hypothetical protein